MEKNRPIIAVIVNEADRSFIYHSLEIIQKDFFAADMDVAVFSTLLSRNEGIATENKLFGLINDELIDGAVIFGNSLHNDDIRALVNKRFAGFEKPVVFIDEYVSTENSTVFDYKESTEALMSHLAECHGIKTAAYVGGSEGIEHFDLFRKNFMRSAKKRGIEISNRNIYYIWDYDVKFGDLTEDIISSGLPDAVICCSDHAAVSVIGELAKRGYTVPDDVIVTGCCCGEPYHESDLNVTSVKRLPDKMAHDAAGKIISAVKGIPFTPYEGSSCELKTGFSCGCERIDLDRISNAVKENIMPFKYDGFDSCYNYMSEDLIGAPSFADYLWKLDWYTMYLEGVKELWMCLNDNIMHSGLSFESYTDNISMPYSKNSVCGTVDLERTFPKSEMLPALFEKREKPSAFVFTPLHMDNINFGYLVLSFGDSGRMYDSTYVKWLRLVTCALEKQRRHSIYRDDTVNAQIRDSLTGLLNIRGFKHLMTEEFNKHSDKVMRIISIDVDNLSGINSAYGYKEGDKMLQKLAVILNNCAGDGDICVRVSGDEFLIAGLLDADNPADEVPLKLERNLESYNSSEDTSYGIHIFTARVTAPFDSLDVLDKLPYEAAYQRTLGKDNHQKAQLLSSKHENEEFDPEERRYVAKMLNDNLLAYQFQPIVNAKTGEIFAYEALMRSGGEIKLSPIAILNHASALGRLKDIERLTFTNLLKFLYENPDKFAGRKLFINSIPSCTLSDSDFDELYSKYGSVMNSLVVEFTEQTEASSEQLDAILERSRRMGFKIAIDDYGTGYSNISNLLNFMPNCVKIDRSLIMNIHSDKRKQHFTKNIIEYAHDNNFMVLAEGVELSEELETVITMGIDLIQGYYTAKPSFEVVSRINEDIADEITQLQRTKMYRVAKKTFFAGDDSSECNLKDLDLDGYTDILVNTKEYTIIGDSSYFSKLSVKIKEGLDCTLNLKNVHMENINSECCIILGNGSSLKLNIIGNVILKGSVRVPDSASVDITGSGRLSILLESNQNYGIGCDPSHSFGNIGIHLKNTLVMKLSSEICVGIGGGFNRSGSAVDICTEKLDCEFSGKKVLGIGCINDDVKINIRDTSMIEVLRCADSVAAGSFGGSSETAVSSSEISVMSEGDNISGFYSSGGSISFADSSLHMKFGGKNICAAGTAGKSDIKVRNCPLSFRLEGNSAFAFGSRDSSGRVLLEGCTGSVSVASANGSIFLAKKERITLINTAADLTSAE